MSDFGDEIKRWYKTGGMPVKLIFFNFAVFILSYLFLFIFLPATRANISEGFYWVAGTADLNQFIYKPWSIFTNIFIHWDFRHLLFNMIGLYVFGNILKNYITEKKFFAIYFLSGVFGTILFMLLFNILPVNGALIPIAGASGSIMGVLAAAIAYAPRLEISLIIFRLPLMLIGVLYIIADLANVFSYGGNMGGSIAHLGGAVFGFFAVTLYNKGTDITGWFIRLTDSIVNLFKGGRNPKPKMKVKYRKSDFKKPPQTKSRRKTDDEFNAEKVSRQAKIDAILDKIKRSGYESLSKAEKDFLFHEGKKL